MPYIDKESRQRLSENPNPTNPGDLNYIITGIINKYVQEKGGVRYSHLNEVIGVLECVKLELYRRIVGPYEDVKRKESGDVYSEVLKRK